MRSEASASISSAAPSPREHVPWLPSGARFVSERGRASLLEEAARCRFLVVDMWAEAGASLRDVIEEGVELTLAHRGALPPTTGHGASASSVVRDQHARLRASAARGIVLALPSLAPFVFDGALPLDDGAALAGWLRLANEDAAPTVVVALAEADSGISVLVPRPLASLVDGEHGLAQVDALEEDPVTDDQAIWMPASGRRVLAVVPALAPTTLPPRVAPVDSERDALLVALETSSLPSRVAMCDHSVTRGEPEVAHVAHADSAAEAQDVVRAEVSSHDQPVKALVEAEPESGSVPPGPEAFDAGEDAPLGDGHHDRWAFADDVIASRAAAPPVDLGELHVPDGPLGGTPGPLRMHARRSRAAHADEHVAMAASLTLDLPHDRAEPEARKVPSRDLEADDFGDGAGELGDIASESRTRPLRDLREVFAEALRDPAPLATPAVRKAPAIQRDDPEERERTAARIAKAAFHRGHAVELEAARGTKPTSVVHELFKKHYVPLLAPESRGELDAATRSIVDEFRTSFAQSYEAGFSQMRMTGRRPTMVCDAPEIAAKLGRASGAKRVQLVLIDAMGWDLGQRVTAQMRERLGARASLVDESLLWSALPSTTPVQSFYLARGPNALRDQDPPTSEPDVTRGRNVSSLRRERLGSREVHKLDLVEARLRAGGDTYDARLDGIAAEVATVVTRFAETLTTRTLLYVFGDHGFVLPPGQGAFSTAPAAQGGASPEEVLVGGFGWVVDGVH